LGDAQLPPNHLGLQFQIFLPDIFGSPIGVRYLSFLDGRYGRINLPERGGKEKFGGNSFHHQ